jgi:2-oxoglutarate dehydrogenase E2 component (dihydrolipoamide succinyltransferase)
LVPEGTQVEPGQLLARLESGAASSAAGEVPGSSSGAAPPRSAVAGAAATERGAEELLSPAVRKLLKEHGLDASQVAGSGRGGRITHQDVLDHLAARGSASPAPPVVAAPAAISGSRRVPHTPMRTTIAAHMVESMLRIAPHVTAVHECDLSAVISHREAHKQRAADEGTRLTLTAYFVRAASLALSEVPQVNARWHEDAIEIFEDHNIGLATALGEEGLIVPVIGKVQTLDVTAIARAVEDYAARARSGALKPKETHGGTFTITNHGTGGSLIATPIINQPQSAILGLGKLQKRAVVISRNGQDEIAIRPMIYVTLTIDHRVLDGFVANRFLSGFTRVLENWS